MEIKRVRLNRQVDIIETDLINEFGEYEEDEVASFHEGKIYDSLDIGLSNYVGKQIVLIDWENAQVISVWEKFVEVVDND